MKIFDQAAFRERPSCVLLDLDNTLYAYPPCNAAGMAAARDMAQRLLGIAPADFDRCFEDARVAIKAQLGKTGSSHSRLLYFQRAIERAGFATQPFVVLQLEQAFWRAYLDAATLFDGVLEFLDDLRIAGIPAIVVTDLTTHIQMRKLILLGLDKLIEWMVSSEESGQDKPDPAGFELALAKIGGVEGPIWMIGDEVEKDLRGAKAALGAVTLHKLDPGQAVPKAVAGVDAAFANFPDLRRLLAGAL